MKMKNVSSSLGYENEFFWATFSSSPDHDNIELPSVTETLDIHSLLGGNLDHYMLTKT